MSAEIEPINGKDEYENYQFNFNTFPVYLAIIPLIYMIPTVFITAKIVRVYLKNRNNVMDSCVNPQIFLIISISQLAGFLNFICEYIASRLMSTGIFTSWCASVQPNHYIKMLLLLNFYFLYAAMLPPPLISLHRLFCIKYPGTHNVKITNLLRISIPFTFIYPSFCVWFLIPAVGICVQLSAPFPFGSLYVYFQHSLWDLRNYAFYLFNIIFWLIICLIINVAFLIELRKTKRKQTVISSQTTFLSNKVQLSVTVTIIAMIIPFITNMIFQILYIYNRQGSQLTKYLRMFGNDFEVVVVPFVFYMTHPVFRRKNTKNLISTTFAKSVRSISRN